MLTVRELLRDLDVRLARRRGEPRRARALGAHLRARRPDAVAVGRRAAADDRDGARRRRRASATFVARLADHGLAGLGLGTGFAHETVPDGAASRRRAERGFPLFEVPYEVPFIAVTEKAFTRLVNEQYAVLQRAIAAHERLERIVLSERGLDAIAGALPTLIGGAGAGLRRPRRAAGAAHVPPRARRRGGRGAAAPSCASAPAAATAAASCPATASSPAARSRCRSARADAPDARRRCPQAWLVAAKDAGGAVRVRPPDAAPGRHGRRARAAAPPRRRRHRAPAGRRRAHRARVAASSRAPSSRAGSSRSGSATASARSCSRRPRAAARRRRGGARPTALRDEARQRPGRRHRAASSCALLPGRRATTSCSRSPSASRARVARRARRRRSPRAPAARSPPGDARARASTRRAARSRRARSARRRRQRRRRRPTAASRPTATSAPSSCCCRCRTTTRCGCSATRSSARSRTARAHYGGELMRSLEAFIECNGQWERAARRLYCHRHTLRYRIRKVEELTGPRPGLARATASSSGSPCAGASSSAP